MFIMKLELHCAHVLIDVELRSGTFVGSHCIVVYDVLIPLDCIMMERAESAWVTLCHCGHNIRR